VNTTAYLAWSSLRRRSRLGLAGVVAVLALAAAALVTGLQVGRGSTEVLDDLARQAEVADLTIGSGVADVLDRIALRPEIAATAGPFPMAFPDLALADGGSVSIRVTATGTTEPTINRPVLRGGRWLRSDGEIVLDRSTARAYGAQVGSVVNLRGPGALRQLTVVGLTVDLTDCAVPQCTPGRGFVTDGDLYDVAGSQYWWTMWATVEPGLDPDVVAAAIDAELGAELTGINTWPDTRGDFLTIDRVFSAFLAGFGAFLLVATAVVLAGSTSARMVQRRREVGIVKTLGATGGQLVAAFVIEQVLAASVAILVGWLAGSALSPLLQVGLSDAVGRSAIDPDPVQLAITAGVVLTVVVISVVVPAGRAARTSAVAALSDDAHPTSALARGAGRLRRPTIGLGLADLVARPLRTGFAVLAASVAVIGTLVASSFLATMTRATTEPRLAGDPWDVSLLANPANATAIEAALEAEPGVAGWFTEYSERGTVGNTPVLARAVGGPYDGAHYEIGEGRAITDPGEALIGHALLDRLDVSIGDRIDLVRDGVRLELTVVGWYRETEDRGAVVVHRLEALAAAGAPVSPNVWLALAQPGLDRAELTSRLAAAVGPLADVREIELDTDLAAFRFVMVAVAALVVLVAALHLAATWLTSGRERAREIGVLRTIGCTDAQLTAQHAVAGAAVAVAAFVIGLPVGFAVNRVLGDLVTTSIGAGPGLTGHPGLVAVLGTGLGAVVGSAGLAALVARRFIAQPTPVLVRYE